MISRRDALRLAAVSVSVAAAAPVVVACSAERTDPAVPDRLLAQLALATRDADAATTAALQDGQYQPALTQVATERTEHAQALRAELERVGVSSTTPPPPPSSPASSGTGAPTTASVRAQLTESASSAHSAAVDSSGFRAGLLAAIAASCSTALAVQLA